MSEEVSENQLPSAKQRLRELHSLFSSDQIEAIARKKMGNLQRNVENEHLKSVIQEAGQLPSSQFFVEFGEEKEKTAGKRTLLLMGEATDEVIKQHETVLSGAIDAALSQNRELSKALASKDITFVGVRDLKKFAKKEFGFDADKAGLAHVDSFYAVTKDGKHFIYLDAEVFQNLASLIIAVNHEAHHMKLFVEKKTPKDRIEEEILVHTNSIKDLESLYEEYKKKLGADFKTTKNLAKGIETEKKTLAEYKKRLEAGKKDRKDAEPKDAKAKEDEEGERSVLTDFFPDTLDPYLREKREKINEGTFWKNQFRDGTRVLFVGERQNVLADKDEIAKALPQLKAAGVKYVAVSFVRKIDQDVVDGFQKNPGDAARRKELLDLLTREWGSVRGLPDKYLSIIEGAAKLGLKVLALDMEKSREKALKERGEEEGDYRQREYHHQRAQTWETEINKALRRNVVFPEDIEKEGKEAKVLVICPESSVGWGGSYANVFLARGGGGIVATRPPMKTKVIAFSGGVEIPAKDFPRLETRVSNGAKRLKIEREKFGVRLDPRAWDRIADYIVHLPQEEKSKEK